MHYSKKRKLQLRFTAWQMQYKKVETTSTNPICMKCNISHVHRRNYLLQLKASSTQHHGANMLFHHKHNQACSTNYLMNSNKTSSY
uniref:Putative ovule protein n=1 Tax=Solanum chacoense TaxID=4108 RepID=A0A0V0HC00_SOLCH